MRVLVTGGAGFIGSHTVDFLIEKGHEVRILDNLEPQVHQGKIPDYLNEKAQLIKADVTDENAWKKSLTDIDAIIHLAAMVGVGQSMYQPVRYLHVNTIGTAKLFETLIKNPELKRNIKKIIVASSKSIYGEGAYKCQEHGVVYPGLRPVEQLEKKDWEVRCPQCNEHVKPVGTTEEKPAQNLSVYALSKFDTERIAVDFGSTLGIPTVAFRYFNVYGPRQSLSNPYTGVCAIFMSRIKNNNPPKIFEDGGMLRDFIYVEDIARANFLAIEKAEKTDVYNVGTGKSTSIKSIAEILIGIFRSNVTPNVTEEFRFGDNRHDYSDITKIKKDLGFVPKWDLKKGMEQLVEWSKLQDAHDKFDSAEQERIKYLGR
jgi:dTDP-L-rhamnose 4-epimerase